MSVIIGQEMTFGRHPKFRITVYILICGSYFQGQPFDGSGQAVPIFALYSSLTGRATKSILTHSLKFGQHVWGDQETLTQLS